MYRNPENEELIQEHVGELIYDLEEVLRDEANSQETRYPWFVIDQRRSDNYDNE